MSLAEAVEISQQALHRLDESIGKATRCIEQLDQLKLAAVSLLGYDPTALAQENLPSAAKDAPGAAPVASYFHGHQSGTTPAAAPTASSALRQHAVKTELLKEPQDGAFPAAGGSAMPPAAATATQPAAGVQAWQPATIIRKAPISSSSRSNLTPLQALQRQAAAQTAAPSAPCDGSRPEASGVAAQRHQVSSEPSATEALGDVGLGRSSGGGDSASDSAAMVADGQPASPAHQQEQQQPAAGGAASRPQAAGSSSDPDDEEDVPLAKRRRKLQQGRQQQKRSRFQRQAEPQKQNRLPPRIFQQQQQQQQQQHMKQEQPQSGSPEVVELLDSPPAAHGQQRLQPAQPSLAVLQEKDADMQAAAADGGEDVVELLDTTSSDEEAVGSQGSSGKAETEGQQQDSRAAPPPGYEQQQQQREQSGQQPPREPGKPPLAPAPSATGPGRPSQQQLFGRGSSGGPGTAGVIKWYAVSKGRRPGLYTTWTDCAGQVLGFRCAEYKTFVSEEAARRYLEEKGVDPAAQQQKTQQQQQQYKQQQQQNQQQNQQQPAAANGADVSMADGGEAAAAAGQAEPVVISDSSDSGDASGGGSCGSRGAFHLSHPVAGQQFKRQFNAPSAGKGGAAAGGTVGGGVSKLTGRKRQSRKGAAAASVPAAKPPQAVEKREQQAWDAIAKAWRQKNMPSQAEIKKAAKEHQAAAAAAAAAAQRRTPLERLQAERAAAAAARAPPSLEGAGRAGQGGRAPDRRAFHRQECRTAVAGLSSFAQVLRVFNVPCDVGRLKDAYRLAVRMYHPDSNSKEKVWHNEDEKLHAEEVMKIINERKPADL